MLYCVFYCTMKPQIFVKPFRKSFKKEMRTSTVFGKVGIDLTKKVNNIGDTAHFSQPINSYQTSISILINNYFR